MAGNKSTRTADTGAGKRRPAPVNRPRSREKKVTGSVHFPEIYPIEATNKMKEQMAKKQKYLNVTENPNAARDQARWDITVQRNKSRNAGPKKRAKSSNR